MHTASSKSKSGIVWHPSAAKHRPTRSLCAEAPVASLLVAARERARESERHRTAVARMHKVRLREMRGARETAAEYDGLSAQGIDNDLPETLKLVHIREQGKRRQTARGERLRRMLQQVTHADVTGRALQSVSPLFRPKIASC